MDYINSYSNDTTHDITINKAVMNLLQEVQSIQMSDVVETVSPPFPEAGKELRNDEICFFKVEKLSYDEEYPQRELFENVLMSLDNQAFNFVYILSGDTQGVSLYIGVVKNGNENVSILDKQLSASNYGQIVESNFQGSFNGSRLRKIKGKELRRVIFEDVEKFDNAGVITGIPSVLELDKEYDFQGIDRLINSMLETNWRLVVVCEPVAKSDILEQQKEVYNFYNWLSSGAEVSWQHSENSGENTSDSHQESYSRGKNKSISKSHGSSTNSGNGEHSSGTNQSKSSSQGTNESHTWGDTSTKGSNWGKSDAVTMKQINKQKQELMKYIDEELLERLKLGLSRGMFNTSVYYMSDNPAHANRLKSAVKVLSQGNKSIYSPLISQVIDISSNKDILKIYQNLSSKDNNVNKNAIMLLGRPYRNDIGSLSTYLTPKEVSVIAGLPQKEVPGLPMQEGVSFALNEDTLDEDIKTVELGKIIHKNRLLDIKFYLDQKCLSKHTFIAGVTGSGKTTTCHKLLREAECPFLVIEPAKTEYRTLINQGKAFGDVIVFTLGNELMSPFRINPFELIKGENIAAHIDMVKAAFTSAFPMEASMPQIIEESIIKCYERHGWSIELNKNMLYGDEVYTSDCDAFPIMSELLQVMREVVEGKHFGDRLQSEYIGTLVSRISNLTVGAKGSMLNCQRSVDFNFIARHNVILELEEMKSSEDKALLMGFILAKLSTTIKSIHKKEHGYKHITLVEEAHRLLAKVNPGENGARKSAVEAFTDLLAEVRKYGEGLVIVDQIPNKLAPDVLKNTNTKIIHRLLAKDDKEAVGDTMLMDDKQKEYLSALSVGEAVVFSENTDKPVQIRVSRVSDTNEAEVDEEIVQQRFEKYVMDESQPLGYGYEEYKIQPLKWGFNNLLESCDTPVDVDLTQKCHGLWKENFITIAEKYDLSEDFIWNKLIQSRLIANGDWFNISLEDKENRIMKLKEILIKSFKDGKISKSIIEEEHKFLKKFELK